MIALIHYVDSTSRISDITFCELPTFLLLMQSKTASAVEAAAVEDVMTADAVNTKGKSHRTIKSQKE